jgi:flagellar assembly protein FliH
MTSSDFEPRLWRAPEVNPAPSPEPLRLTAERIEALEAEVREAAQEAGFKEGLASGEKRVRERIAALDEMLSHLADPLRRMDQTLEDTLLLLSLSFAEAILGQAPPASQTALSTVLREALDALPDPQAEAVVYLSPADETRLRDALGDGLAGRPVRFEGDSELGPGDVHVRAGLAEVDATRRTRFRQLFESLLPHLDEGERAQDP